MSKTDKYNDPQDHWLDMPDFEQVKQSPFACVNVRFDTEEDFTRFCELTGMKLTRKTKSAWFPEMKPSGVGSKRWI
jgi:hypothetical protein